MAVQISQNGLEIWADYLVNYSIGGIQPEDVVMLKGEHVCWPLMSVLQDKIIKAGGIVDMNIVAPDNDRGKVWGAAMAMHGTIEQINRVPDWQKSRYEAMTKYIEILGSESPVLFENLPDDKVQAIFKADEPFKTIRLAKPWVLTLYPTEGFAAMEGMDLDEYTRIIVDASTVDPRLLEKVEEDIYQLMSRSETITIETEHPENGKLLRLTMNIAEKNIIKCTGERNFPDGEVFTSPDANTVSGEIFVDLPVYYSGATIQGIYLQFEVGKITDYQAKQGHETLRKIIETDEGSKRLGEVAFGMNNGIQRVLKHPWFVEKVGGTLHIAIGASYPECFIDNYQTGDGQKALEDLRNKGILNKSAQHVDIVTDFRPGGTGRAVYLDDVKLDIEDNIWIVPRG
jgi:aminopeptidase